MNRLECLNILPIRKHLSQVCQSMLAIARPTDPIKRKIAYDDTSEEYLKLAKVRDELILEMMIQWKFMNKEYNK